MKVKSKVTGSIAFDDRIVWLKKGQTLDVTDVESKYLIDQGVVDNLPVAQNRRKKIVGPEETK